MASRDDRGLQKRREAHTSVTCSEDSGQQKNGDGNGPDEGQKKKSAWWRIGSN